MTRSIPMLLVAAGVAFGGCGGPSGDDGTSGAASADPRDAGVRFSRCMRENGIDMPDPRTDERGVTLVGPASDGGRGGAGMPPSSRFRVAEEKCRRHLKDVKPPQLSPEQAADFKRMALAHAKCMRENGVDFPDPRFSQDGGAVVDIGPGSGLDPRSPVFQRAQAECRQLEGGPGSGANSAGGAS